MSRAAWRGTSSSIGKLEARNFGYDELPARNLRYDGADEVMEALLRAVGELGPDALSLDKESGVFADPAKVHYVDYAGKWSRRAGRSPCRAARRASRDHAGRTSRAAATSPRAGRR